MPDPVDSFWVTAGLDVDGKPFRSVTQGAGRSCGDPAARAGGAPAGEAPEAVKRLLAAQGGAGRAVEDVRASVRLTDSPVCLVASESGMDRELERILSAPGSFRRRPAGAGDQPAPPPDRGAGRPGRRRPAVREDVAHLLYDEARILDGEPPEDPRGFADRLTRLMQRGLPIRT